VIDVDRRHGGAESMKALVARHGPLPPTWRAITGGGGWHIHFKGRAACCNGRWPGVDIKSDGGYVAMPPSNHLSGHSYRWQRGHGPDNVPLAEAPLWLLQELGKPRKAGAPVDWQERCADVPEGKRNVAVTSIAGLLLRRIEEPFLALDLVRGWNLLRCHPPLDDSEVVKIVNSIAAKELSRRGLLR
jgi:putative DNA primase/helicase